MQTLQPTFLPPSLLSLECLRTRPDPFARTLCAVPLDPRSAAALPFRLCTSALPSLTLVYYQFPPHFEQPMPYRAALLASCPLPSQDALLLTVLLVLALPTKSGMPLFPTLAGRICAGSKRKPTAGACVRPLLPSEHFFFQCAGQDLAPRPFQNLFRFALFCLVPLPHSPPACSCLLPTMLAY